MIEPAGKSRARVSGGRRWAELLWPVIVVAVVVAGLVAWRATLGVSFQDDGYYAAATVRLAQGARLFVDEMFLQSLGFLVAVPFAKLWTSLFGLTGVVAALRLFYVAVAAAAAVAVYRLLRPSFGPWVSLAGAVVPFLAPAYNLFAVTYDTMAALGMVLACALAFAAVRDRRRWLAAVAGVFAAFASVSYPPFVIVAFVLLLTFAVRSRDRRLVGAMALGAAALVLAFAAWLLATTSFAELARAAHYVIVNWLGLGGGTRGTRLASDLGQLIVVLGRTWKAPLWLWFAPAAAISVWVAYSGSRAVGHGRARGLALAMLPVALAIPVFADWSSFGHRGALWTLGGNYVIAFLLFVALPMFVSLRGTRSDIRDLVMMALPVGVAGLLMVDLSSNASIYWASGVVGLAPLVVAAVAWWVREVAETVEPLAGAAATVMLIGALLVLLFGTTFKDAAPLTLHHTLGSGAYAGVTTNATHAAEVAELERLAATWIRPSTTVTAIGMPGAYLVTGGVPLTNVDWLNADPTDVFTVQYFDRLGRWPDVVLMPLAVADESSSTVVTDPLLSAVRSRYRLVERSKVATTAVYVRIGSQ